MRLVLTSLITAVAATAWPAHAGGVLVKDRPEAAARASLAVTSTAFANGGVIPVRHSGDGANRAPPLAWTPAKGAASYVVIVEDPDAPAPTPFVHWLAWNISTPGLPEGGAAAGVAHGRNGFGSTGYGGPRPPPGAAHHYHFEVFALDGGAKTPAPGADRKALVAALRGHVLAKGDLVGTFQRR